jgi:hypothetical protein
MQVEQFFPGEKFSKVFARYAARSQLCNKKLSSVARKCDHSGRVLMDAVWAFHRFAQCQFFCRYDKGC